LRSVPMAIDIPRVDVAVAIIVRRDRLLISFSLPWSSFTLPMTKRRLWQDPQIPAATREEPWVEAAARAAGESLGQTFTQAPEYLADLAEFRQGDRDGVW